MEEPSEEGQEEDLLPRQEPEEVPLREGEPKALEEWERLEVEAEDVAVMNYTLVETMTSRQGGTSEILGHGSETCPQ